MLKISSAIVMTLVCLTMMACSTLSKLTTPAAQPFVQAAVDVAVATAIQKGIPAAQIKSIAQQVLAADSGTTVALGAVQALVLQKIAALKLPPADAVAAQLLVATLNGIIQVQLSGATAQKITAETQVAIADLFNDVIVATSAYGL
jgi:hypothetical protein